MNVKRPLPAIPTQNNNNNHNNNSNNINILRSYQSLPHLSYPRAKTCTVTTYQPQPCIELTNELQQQINNVIININNNNYAIDNENNILDIVQQHNNQLEQIQQQRTNKQIEQQKKIEQQLNNDIQSRKNSNSVLSPSSTSSKPPIQLPNQQQHQSMTKSFTELTDVSDINKINTLLELLDWDLDRSVALYFSDDPPSIDDCIDKAKLLKR